MNAVPCLCLPEAFGCCVFSPLPDSALLRFVSSQGTYLFGSTLFLKSTADVSSSFHFSDDFHFPMPFSSVEQDACCDRCPHSMQSGGTDAICGSPLKEVCWPSEGDTAVLPHTGGPRHQDRNPDVSPGSATEQQEILQAITQHKLHHRGYIGEAICILVVGNSSRHPHHQCRWKYRWEIQSPFLGAWGKLRSAEFKLTRKDCVRKTNNFSMP